MILVGVGIHHILQGLHTLRLEIRDNQLGISHIAAVNEHGLPFAVDENAVSLSYVDIVNLQALCGELRVHRR